MLISFAPLKTGPHASLSRKPEATFLRQEFRRDFHVAFSCKLNDCGVMAREGDCPYLRAREGDCPYLRAEFFRP
jgi:hypothetical protein